MSVFELDLFKRLLEVNQHIRIISFMLNIIFDLFDLSGKACG